MADTAIQIREHVPDGYRLVDVRCAVQYDVESQPLAATLESDTAYWEAVVTEDTSVAFHCDFVNAEE